MRAVVGGLLILSGTLLFPLQTLAADLNLKPPALSKEMAAARHGTALADLVGTFSWSTGIASAFVSQQKPGLRPLEEYDLTQHYTQWRGDIDLAASLGVSKMRWAVPWYRVEPRPGDYDWRFVDDVLDYMVNVKHIEPIIDLAQSDTPAWLVDGVGDAQYQNRATAYSREFAVRYKELVRYYTPVGEPLTASQFSGKLGQWPPYWSDDSGYCRVVLALAKSIQASGKAIREEDQDCALVAMESVQLFQPKEPELESAAKERFGRSMLAWDLVSGRVDSSHPLYKWLLDNGVKADELEKLRESKLDQDVFGINFYSGAVHKLNIDDGKEVDSAMTGHGALLGQALKRAHVHTNKPLFVTGTSIAGTDKVRASWLDATLNAVRTARGDSLPVVGYTWYPLFTMVEPKYRTSTEPLATHLVRSGLWDCRFDKDGVFVRTPTRLVADYRKAIKGGIPGGDDD